MSSALHMRKMNLSLIYFKDTLNANHIRSSSILEILIYLKNLKNLKHHLDMNDLMAIIKNTYYFVNTDSADAINMTEFKEGLNVVCSMFQVQKDICHADESSIKEIFNKYANLVDQDEVISENEWGSVIWDFIDIIIENLEQKFCSLGPDSCAAFSNSEEGSSFLKNLKKKIKTKKTKNYAKRLGFWDSKYNSKSDFGFLKHKGKKIKSTTKTKEEVERNCPTKLELVYALESYSCPKSIVEDKLYKETIDSLFEQFDEPEENGEKNGFLDHKEYSNLYTFLDLNQFLPDAFKANHAGKFFERCDKDDNSFITKEEAYECIRNELTASYKYVYEDVCHLWKGNESEGYAYHC